MVKYAVHLNREPSRSDKLLSDVQIRLILPIEDATCVFNLQQNDNSTGKLHAISINLKQITMTIDLKHLL